MDLIQSLVRPSEAVALVQFKSKYGSTKRGGATAGQLDENLQYCYDSLFKTSRSFAMVIADLGDDLRDAVRTTLATTQPTNQRRRRRSIVLSTPWLSIEPSASLARVLTTWLLVVALE